MPPQRQSPDIGTAFKLLCEQLGRALKKTGSIRLLNTTIEKLKTAFATARAFQTGIPHSYVAELVSLLDGQADACRRLEPKTYVVILESVLHAGYSRPQERGVYLLAASLFYDCHGGSANSPKTISRRKAAIGKGCLWALLDCFTNPAEDVRVRRWVGVLISSLLESCGDNMIAFEAGPEDEKRKLGKMVVEERNEILRTSCGQLLNALIAWDIPPENLWPFNTSAKIYSEFPTASQSDKSWNRAFQVYADQLSAGLSSQQDVGTLYFPLAVTTEGHAFNAVNCNINLLIGNELSIYTNSGGSGIYQSLDVPFHLVSEVIISETLLDDGTRAPDQPLVVIVTLRSREDASCYLNALPIAIKEVHISVHDDKMAEVMGLEIDNASKRPKISQTSDTIAIGARVTGWPTIESQGSANGSIAHSGMEKSNSQTSVVDLVSAGPRHSYQQQAVSDSPPDIPNDVLLKKAIKRANPQDSKNQQDLAPDHAGLMCAALHRGISDETPENMLVGGTKFHQSRVLRNPSAHLDLDENWLLEDDFYDVKPLPKSSMKDPPQILGALPRSILAGNITDPSTHGLSPRRHVNNHVCNDLGEDSASFLSPILVPGREQPSSVDPNARLEAENDSSSPETIRSKTSRSRHRKSSSKPKPRPTHSSPVSRKQISCLKAKRTEILSEVPLVADIIIEAKSPGAPHGHSRAIAAQNRPTSHSPAIVGAQAVESKSIGTAAAAAADPLNRAAENRNAIITYPVKLSHMLEGIDDFESRIEPPMNFLEVPKGQTLSEKRQPTVATGNARKSLSPQFRSVRAAQRNEYAFHLGGVPHRSEEPPHRSPRILSRTREATTMLNRVLGRDSELLDDRLIRKKPLVFFTSRGPRNQGSSSAKKSSEPRLKKVTKAHSSRLEMDNNIKERELKRKRSMQITPEQEIVKRNCIGTLQSSLPTVTPRRDGLDSEGGFDEQEQAGQDQQDDLSIIYYDAPESIPINKTLVTGQKQGLGSQHSRVDENGSPRASSITNQQREQYRIIAGGVMRDEKAIVGTISNDVQKPHRNPDNEDLRLSLNFDLQLPPYATSEVSNIEAVRPCTSAQANLMEDNAPSPHAEGKLVSCHRLRESGNIKVILSSTDDGNDNPSYNSKETFIAEELPGRHTTQKVSTKARRFASPLLIRRHEIVFGQTSQRRDQDNVGSATEDSLQPQSKSRPHASEDLEQTLVEAQDDVQMEEGSSSSDKSAEVDGCKRQHTDQLSGGSDDQIPLDIWREALRPHQRDMLDTLCKMSSDLVRYLISNEEAIADVIEEYKQYGNKLIEEYRQKQQTDCQRMQQRFEKVKKVMEEEYQQSQWEIVKSARETGAQAVGTFEKNWRRQQERLMQLIVKGKGKVAG